MGESETVCSVFGAQFCSRRTVDLTIFGSGGFYTVNDATTHVVKFRVVKIGPGLRQIWDVAGKPIATLRRKALTAHGRWQVFRGDSKREEDMVFSLASPSIFNFIKPKYHVFLGTNRRDEYEDCDFKVTGKWDRKKTLSICDAKSPANIISQVDRKQKDENGNEVEAKVKVNMDQAFVVAVIMIIDAIYEEEPAGKSGGAGAAKGAFGALEATANVLSAFSSN